MCVCTLYSCYITIEHELSSVKRENTIILSIKLLWSRQDNVGYFIEARDIRWINPSHSIAASSTATVLKRFPCAATPIAWRRRYLCNDSWGIIRSKESEVCLLVVVVVSVIAGDADCDTLSCSECPNVATTRPSVAVRQLVVACEHPCASATVRCT